METKYEPGNISSEYYIKKEKNEGAISKGSQDLKRKEKNTKTIGNLDVNRDVCITCTGKGHREI